MSEYPPLSSIMHEEWAQALAPVEPQIRAMGDFCAPNTPQGTAPSPPGRHFRAFARPMSEVKVLILGQDPYPTPGHAMGMSFSVHRDVRPLPRSLNNIYRELNDDLGIAPAEHGDLSSWADEGVMLMNRVLSVREGKPASHRNKGWEQVTQQAIEALVARDNHWWAAVGCRCTPHRAHARTVPVRGVGAPLTALSQQRVLRLPPVLTRERDCWHSQGATGVDWHVK